MLIIFIKIIVNAEFCNTSNTFNGNTRLIYSLYNSIYKIYANIILYITGKVITQNIKTKIKEQLTSKNNRSFTTWKIKEHYCCKTVEAIFI